MIIGSDLVLGVANAADAARQREAMAKLQKLNNGKSELATASNASATRQFDRSEGVASDSWSAHVSDSGSPRAEAQPQVAAHTPRTRVIESSSSESNVYTQFEAVLLQNMVEEMMPKDSQAMFGSGTAGNMWKSMLAEKIAEQIAKSGALGIAEQIEAGQNALTSARAAANKNIGDA
ncbi:rod-binding protein [Hyphomicrobium sp. D-2]|uniref:rod-binding protein n=1 Tax=Hyphomicrobium sp. D-2 TaxID=3041621 RepID=UPI002453AA00|nr:rod-binding protein [Hyphomicrobium sp. D-2]MDH4983631.1 rod-binding protein [Hyphomicrobium sp. D-2]